MDLPFGLKGTEDVLDALHDVEQAIDTRPDLQERLVARNEAKDKLKDEMVRTKVLSPEAAKNPSYFRHQVLEYANFKQGQAAGSKTKGAKVRTGYVHSRKGSEKDINANYFQAEADWMYKAHQDIATAKFINWMRDDKLNSKAEIVAEAKASNAAALDARLRDDPEFAAKYRKHGTTVNNSVDNLRRAVARPEIERQIPPDLAAPYEQLVSGKAVEDLRDDSGQPAVVQLGTAPRREQGRAGGRPGTAGDGRDVPRPARHGRGAWR